MLDKAEFLVTFIFQTFGEKRHIGIQVQVNFHTVDYRGSLLKHKVFQAIFLSQISIKELFHSFLRDWDVLVMFEFRLKYFNYELF